MTSHTPGPWHYSTITKIVAVNGARPGSMVPIAELIGFQCRSDGILMAAAPDLLEACQDALAILDSRWLEGRDHGQGKILAGAMKDAIAKATGQEPAP